MSGATKWGSEFLVNTIAGASQYEPAVTALADGRFVAAWTDSSETGTFLSGDNSGRAVRAQIFNADGTKVGGEFLVNTTTSSNQAAPAIAALDDGRFVISWSDESQSAGDTSGEAVRAQIFEGDGSRDGPELVVNTTTSGDQYGSTVTALSGGGFVVAWNDLGESGGDISDGAVRLQVFDSEGGKVGQERLANSTTFSGQGAPTITALGDGRFVVAWSDYSMSGGDLSGHAIRAQLFNANGTKSGSEFLVNSVTAYDEGDPAVTALAGGGFVVTWQGGGDGSGVAVRAQVFDAAGDPAGGEFVVNTSTSLHQTNPTTAALADGRFVVAWEDTSHSSGDTSESAVRAQLFNADGTKSGMEFLVNTTAIGPQGEPSVTVLADGRFVVGWTDQSQSGGDPFAAGVHGQVFDPRESALSLAGTTLDDDHVGTGFNDTMGASGGNDHLAGAGGNDSLSGGLDDDLVDGGTGSDTMAGGAGDDTFVVDSAGDVVSELANQGFDTVLASANCTLAANVENLTLTGAAAINGTGNGLDNVIYGNNGANILNGAAGADTLLGGADNDTLLAGAGKDLMTGGGGLDHFNFTSLSESGTTFAQRDVINTFAHGDKVDLSALDANANAVGNQAFSFVASFTGAAGQLQWDQTAPTGFLIQGDVNGDGAADFSLQIYAAPGFGQVQSWDFIL